MNKKCVLLTMYQLNDYKRYYYRKNIYLKLVHYLYTKLKKGSETSIWTVEKMQ